MLRRNSIQYWICGMRQYPSHHWLKIKASIFVSNYYRQRLFFFGQYFMYIHPCMAKVNFAINATQNTVRCKRDLCTEMNVIVVSVVIVFVMRNNFQIYWPLAVIENECLWLYFHIAIFTDFIPFFSQSFYIDANDFLCTLFMPCSFLIFSLFLSVSRIRSVIKITNVRDKIEEKKVTRKLNIINIKIKVTFLLTVCIADRLFDIGMLEMWKLEW